MNIPRYWAEAIAREPHGERIIRIRRFGWSHASQADAQAMADQRAQEALDRTKAGETVDRSEPRVPYNGADGMPIREQILSEHGDTIVTRNSYGAHCLNTPNVMFVDMDWGVAPSRFGCFSVVLAAAACGLFTWISTRSPIYGIFAFMVTVAAAGFAKHLWIERRAAGSESLRRAEARARFDRWMASHANWRVRLYETPAGFRVMVTSDVFDPVSEEVGKVFRDLEADPEYANMCIHQRCFRARLTAKPWRTELETHIVPRPGVWPLSEDKLPRRNAWIEQYEAAAANFAACRFVGEFGTATAHPEADAVRRLHDELSGALSGKPIA